MTVFAPLAIFLAALILQGLFAGYETGFISANPIRVRYLAEEEGSRRARRLLRYIEKPDQMLTMLLIGTNVMVVTCTLVVSFEVTYLDRYLPERYVGLVDNIVSTAVVAPIMLVFSEILPKSVFRTHPTRLSLALLPVIEGFYAIFFLLAAPLSWATRGLLRLFGGEHIHISPLMTSIEELRNLVDEGLDHGAIERDEQEMIHSVIDMQDMTAKEIMAPRIAIEALPDTATRSELVRLFVDTGRTRIPVYHETIDKIIGVVSAYAILRDNEPDNEDISRFVREVKHVPDTMKVDDLFRELKKVRQHLAIVTDEYGGTDGLVTIEDILEEIFGEIQDEHDNEESPIHKLGPRAFVVDARTSIEDLSEATGVEIVDEDVETVGGWLMHLAGHIPMQGEVIMHERFRVTVLAGGPNYVSKMRVEILPPAEDSKSQIPAP